MLECKKALAAEKGDVSKAMDWLRAKGIAKAAANVLLATIVYFFHIV